MKIAYVCDWLTGMRGGEKCLEALCQLYPRADIFTLIYAPENFNGEFENHTVYTSFIQKLAGKTRSFRRYLPLFPKAIESFELSDYDCVVSFSHCVAKGVRVPSPIPHICYCHTPVRYGWDMRDAYLARMSPVRRWAASLFLNRLKRWDQATANRVRVFLANSRCVQQRISRCYNRDSTIVYPPVDVERFTVSTKDEEYYLVLGSFVPYKRFDLAIEAFNQNGRRLIVAGGGTEASYLKSIAKSHIEFVVNPDNAAVERLYAGCRALVFPGEEDFGIVPLEAQACGKPVIAYGKGGALETVIGPGAAEAAPTGLFFREQTVSSLQEAVEQFEKNKDTIKARDCRQNANRFHRERYQRRMTEIIESVMAQAGRL